MKDFFDLYLKRFARALHLVDKGQLLKMEERLLQCYFDDKQLFICGNGGSASLASHMVNDFNKGILGHKADKNIKRFRAISLCDNVSLMTAWANDLGYENIFSEQLKNLMNNGDVLLVISSSGNSPNIIDALKMAKELGGVTMSLTGFNGGQASKLSDMNVTIPVQSYQITEDIHGMIGHIITNYFLEYLEEITRQQKSLKYSKKKNVLQESFISR